MHQPIRIVIPGTPVAKGRARIGRGFGGQAVAFTPKKTVAYENLIKMKAEEVMAGAPPLDCALRVVITAYVPVPASWSQKKHHAAVYGDLRPTTRPDADNYLKAALDGMNGVVFRDDSLVTDASIGKRYSDHPQLVIEVFA